MNTSVMVHHFNDGWTLRNQQGSSAVPPIPGNTTRELCDFAHRSGLKDGHFVPNNSQFLTNRDVAGELPAAGTLYRRKGQQKSGKKRGCLSISAGHATSSSLAGPSALALSPTNLRRPLARRCEAHHIWLIFSWTPRWSLVCHLPTAGVLRWWNRVD